MEKFTPMYLQLSSEQRAQIVVLHEAGMSYREIANKFKVSISTVHRTLKKVKETGKYKHFGMNGRPSKLDDSLSKAILKEISENSQTSLRKIAFEVEKKTQLQYHMLV